MSNVKTPGMELAFRVTDLIREKHMGAALNVARQGWRDFPREVLPQVGSFEQLVMKLATMVPGGVAEPAAAEGAVQAAAPVSAVPVSAAPVSVHVIPVSAVPVNVVPAGEAVPVVIERSDGDGTIIKIKKGMPMLKPVLQPLGWGLAKRGFFYASDRDSAPNMALIAATVMALDSHGIKVVNTVRGDESARPVSAPPAAAVSAVPVSAVRAVRKPTRRQLAKGGPVTVRYVAPVSAVPVSAAPAAVFQAPVPVSAPPVAPVSAVPAPVAAAAVDPTLAAILQTMQSMQAEILALKTGAVPAVPVAAPVVPVVAPVVPVVSVQAEEPSMDDVLASMAPSPEIAEIMEMSWNFRIASGANQRHTATEIREDLRQRVSDWWSHHELGQVRFSVYVRSTTADDGSKVKTVHVGVTSAAGKLKKLVLSTQVKGTVLGVKGIIGTTTIKQGTLQDA